MIVDRLEDWARAGRPSTPERRAWVKAYVAKAAVGAMHPFIPSEAEARPPVTLSASFWCARKIHYAMQAVAGEEVAPRVLNTFLTGGLVEAGMVARTILAGLPVISPLPPDFHQMRLELPVGGDLLRGSMDLVLAADLMGQPEASVEALRAYRGPIIVTDVKSMSGRSFDQAVDERRVGNKFGYEDQLQNYRRACIAHGWKVSALLFLLHKKDTGHEAEVVCPVEPDQPGRVEAAYLAAKAGLPERPSWATIKEVRAPGGRVTQIDQIRCELCAYRATCWPGYERQIVSGKPVYRKPVEVVNADRD